MTAATIDYSENNLGLWAAGPDNVFSPELVSALAGQSDTDATYSILSMVPAAQWTEYAGGRVALAPATAPGNYLATVETLITGDPNSPYTETFTFAIEPVVLTFQKVFELKPGHSKVTIATLHADRVVIPNETYEVGFDLEYNNQGGTFSIADDGRASSTETLPQATTIRVYDVSENELSAEQSYTIQAPAPLTGQLIESLSTGVQFVGHVARNSEVEFGAAVGVQAQLAAAKNAQFVAAIGLNIQQSASLPGDREVSDYALGADVSFDATIIPAADGEEVLPAVRTHIF